MYSPYFPDSLCKNDYLAERCAWYKCNPQFLTDKAKILQAILFARWLSFIFLKPCGGAAPEEGHSRNQAILQYPRNICCCRVWSCAVQSSIMCFIVLGTVLCYDYILDNALGIVHTLLTIMLFMHQVPRSRDTKIQRTHYGALEFHYYVSNTLHHPTKKLQLVFTTL